MDVCYGVRLMIPHKVLKTSPHPKQPPSAGIQPMVISFAKPRHSFVSSKILLVAFGALASFFITSLFALFILGDQINHLWREAQTVSRSASVPVVKIEKEADFVKDIEPEAAFPAATIAPLPSKALIVGRDFQQPKASAKELAPMLAQLPLYDKPTKPRGSFVEVETVRALTKSSTLLQQADEAIADGNTQKAIQLYIRAVQLNPNDAGLRSNCVALLLQEARSYDEQGEIDKALGAYKKAQALWQGDSQTAQSINARIAFLENN